MGGTLPSEVFFLPISARRGSSERPRAALPKPLLDSKLALQPAVGVVA